MDYLALKWMHVLASTVLFGTGTGSAFYLLAATLGRDARTVAAVARYVVRADWLFTTPTAILQPATGLWLLHLSQVPWATPWVRLSLALYAIAMACWLPVVWIQYRLRDLAVQAALAGAPLPPAYWRLFAWWVGLGASAFLAFLLIFWLMVAKALPWE